MDNRAYLTNFQHSHCKTLEESMPIIPETIRMQSNDKNQSKYSLLDENLRQIPIHEETLVAFCGLWKVYPNDRYRMEFRIEKGQLVGYSNVHRGKALASFDGRLLNMVIVHGDETGRPLGRYRGRLGWNRKYIVWEKEDSSRQFGWRPTKRWIKVE